MIIVYIVIGIFTGWFTKIPWYYNKLKTKNRLMYKDLDVLFNTMIQHFAKVKQDIYKDRYKMIKDKYKRL